MEKLTNRFLDSAQLAQNHQQDWADMLSMEDWSENEQGKLEGGEALKSLLQASKQAKKTRPIRRWLGYAVAASLVFAITLWYINISTPPTIVAFQPKTIRLAYVQTADLDLKKEYESIVAAYQAKNYQEVVIASQKTLATYKHETAYNPRITLLLAMSYFEQGDFRAAISAFDAVFLPSDDMKSQLPYLANYYKAIAYYRLQENQKAAVLFKSIASEAPSDFVAAYAIKKWIKATI